MTVTNAVAPDSASGPHLLLPLFLLYLSNAANEGTEDEGHGARFADELGAI